MNSFAKVNIFLKITGKRDNYHTLISRFMIVKNLFDTISFEKNDKNSFNLEGNFSCPIEKNTIYKAYNLLLQNSNKKNEIERFFEEKKIVIDKHIPEFAGLGGGSSNCATFLKMANEELNLGFSIEKLAFLSSTIGADVPFFVYGYESANVSGIGEIVEKYDEKALEIETFTPPIKCDTPSVYKEFSKNFYKEYKDIEYIKNINSLEYLKNNTIELANDLYAPAISLYPELKNYQKDGLFFSGSGSTFFKII